MFQKYTENGLNHNENKDKTAQFVIGDFENDNFKDGTFSIVLDSNRLIQKSTIRFLTVPGR